MKSNSKLAVASAVALLGTVAATQAQILVYENLTTSRTADYSEPNTNSPIFGDSLTLPQGGTVSIFGCSLYNSSQGRNTGSIMWGNMGVNFYDNTVPYTGGVLSNPLLGSVSLPWDFSNTGALPAGDYATFYFDLTSFGIIVPQNILVTQQFMQIIGTSTRNGVVLMSDPTIGSSPPTVYIKSAATAEGLYTFSGNPGQFAYHVEVVPEPSMLALASLGAIASMMLRRRS